MEEGPVYEETGEIYCLLLLGTRSSERAAGCLAAGKAWETPITPPMLIAVTTTANVYIAFITCLALF